jgi:hypothetical protein
VTVLGKATAAFGGIIDREQNMTIPRWSFQQRALMIDSDGVEWSSRWRDGIQKTNRGSRRNIMKLKMDA